MSNKVNPISDDSVLNVKNNVFPECMDPHSVSLNETSSLSKYNKGQLDQPDPSVNIDNLSLDEQSLYSMKFPKPRTLTPNLSPPTGLNDLQLSYIWIQRLKGKDDKYDKHISTQINTLLAIKREREKLKRDDKASLNNLTKNDDKPPTLGYTPIKLKKDRPPFLALVDTGASLSFLHTSLVNKYGLKYKKQSMILNTANGSDDNNIQGVLTTDIYLTDFSRVTFPVTLKFLVCKNLNGNMAILGSNFTNSAFVSAHLIILPYENSLKSVPIYQRSSTPDAYYIYVPIHDYELPPQSVADVKCKILKQDHSCISSNFLATEGLLYNVRTDYMKKGLKPSAIQQSVNHDLFSLRLSNLGKNDLNIAKNSVLGEILLNFAPSVSPDDRQQQIPSPTKIELFRRPATLFSSSTLTRKTNRPPIDVIEKIENQTFLEPLSEFTETLSIDMINYDNCPSEYLETAKAISQRYPLAFAKNKLDVGDSSSPNDYFVPIDTLPGKIAKDKRRILSGYHLDYAQSVIQEYVNHGLMVENADGEYRTNIFMVPKKVEATQSFTKIDKINSPPPPRLRCVFDLRSLNKILKVKYSTNLPTIDSVHSLLMHKYVILFDISNCFSSMKIKKSDRHKCAFYLNEKVYTPVMCLQGLLSAPYHWEQISKIIFSEKRFQEARLRLSPKQQQLTIDIKIGDCLITYADDNYLCHRDIRVLLVLYECALIMAIRGGVKINPSKCDVITTRCNALGIDIDTMDGTKSLSMKKIEALLLTGAPNSLFELQSKLCSFLYLLKFLNYLQFFVFPLSLMLRLKRFVWDDIAKEAYEMLCLLVRLHLTLCVPEKNERLCLTTDGSRYALAGCLFVERNQHLEIVQCTSKINSLTHYHRNSFVLEIMALIHSLTTFWPYLVNCEKDIFALTDAKSLLYNKRMQTHSLASQNLCDYLVNQLSQLPNLILVHIIGPGNICSDILSRSFEARFQQDTHPLSKQAALNLPPLPDGFILTSDDVLAYLNSPTLPESSDIWQRNKKHSLPPKIDDIFSKLERPTMENRIYQLDKIMKGWADDFVAKQSATLNSLITTMNKEIENEYLLKINALLEKYFFDLKKSTYYTRLKHSLMDSFKVMIKHQHSPGPSFDKIMTEKLTDVNNLIDLVQQDLDKKCPNIDLKSEATTLAKQSLFHILHKEEFRAEKVPSPLTIWLHSKRSSSIQHEHDVTIYLHVTAIIQRISKTTIPLPVYLDIDDSFYIKLEFPSINEHRDLKILGFEMDFKTLTIPLSLENMSQQDIFLNTDCLPIVVKLFRKMDIDKNSIDPVSFFDICTQVNFLGDFPTISILDKIINPSRQYCFLLQTNVYFTEGAFRDFLSADNMHCFDLYNTQQQNKSESPPPPHEKQQPESNDPQMEIMPDKYSEEERRLQHKMLLAEDDIRRAGRLTKEVVFNAQQTDEMCIKIREKLKKNENISYTIKNKLIYKLRPKNPRLFLPSALAPGILLHLHNENFHPSSENLMSIFNEHFFTPLLQSWARRVTNGCFICTISKHPYLPAPTRQTVKRRIDEYSYMPRQSLSIDIILTESTVHRYGLVIMDLFSQYLHIRPMRNKTSKTVAEILHQHFLETDIPSAVLSDQDMSFQDEVSQLFFKLGIIHFQSYPYSQNLNMVESSTKAFKMALRLFLTQYAETADKISNWHIYASRAVSFINRRKLKGVNYTRYELYYGVPPNENNLFYDEFLLNASDEMSKYLIQRDNLISTCHQLRLKMIASKSDSPKKTLFKKNDIVFVKERVKNTLKQSYQGPFLILEIHPQGAAISCLRTNKTSYTHQRYLKKLDLSTYIQSFPRSILQNYQNKTSRDPFCRQTESPPPPPFSGTENGVLTRSKTKQNPPPSVNSLTFYPSIQPLWTMYQGYSRFRKISIHNIKFIDNKPRFSNNEIVLENKPLGTELLIVFKTFPAHSIGKHRKKLRFSHIRVKYI